MRLYLANTRTSMQNMALALQGLAERNSPLRVRHILLSYHYLKNLDLYRWIKKYFVSPYPSIFLDSGAFSAYSQGLTIDRAEYCRYIQTHHTLLSAYSNLDVIGDPEQTLANQRYMEEYGGLAPLPVFHVGEDWSFLDRYLERYPYIALGGMVPYNTSNLSRQLMPWLVQCFKRAGKRAVYHGFGCTAWRIASSFPWYSIDSSTWSQAFRFGKPQLFDERAGHFVEVALGDYQTCYKRAPLFRSLGFDPADFSKDACGYQEHICTLAVYSFLLAEQWLERRHGQVTIPGSNWPSREWQEAWYGK